MFIISLHFTKPLDEVEKHVSAHRAFLEKYFAADTFICSGRKAPQTGGIIMARAASRDEVERLILEDPFHVNGIAEYEIIEFTPTKYSERFKSLLD